MKPSRTLLQAIAFVVAAVYLIGWVRQGLPTQDALKWFGAAGSAGGMFVLAYDHVLWRLPWVGRLISKRPDLRGTWQGTLASHWEDPKTGQRIAPKRAYLVVRQTFWSVTANLITDESKSCSTTATIEDDGCGQYQLVAMYRNTPRAAVRDRSEVHHGSFKLDIDGQPVGRLEGYYWTDRNTMGEFEFDARSKKKAESFAAAEKLTFE